MWDTIIGDGYAQSFQNKFYALVESIDNSGYVAGGIKKEYLPEEEQTASTGTTISQGWLVKVDEDGEVLWDRTYHYVDTPNERQTLNDLKATSDGGYIFCGESRDDSAEAIEPTQQGWLVKLDQHGCLVEGCHLSDNIEELSTSTEYFKAGPVPAGDFLNIYQTKALDNSFSYQLHDMNGKLIEHFPAADFQTTFMLPVHELSLIHI